MIHDPRPPTHDPLRVAILHGAGYAGGELLRLLLGHPYAETVAVTSRSQAGKPVWTAHPALRGQTDLVFIAPVDLDVGAFDAAFVAAEHGQGAAAVVALRGGGFAGLIIDLSADHRFRDPAIYPDWFGFEHPAPEYLVEAAYGLVEVNAPYPTGTRLIANPGCFATGLALALHPLAQHLGDDFEAHVTALTGASGSGTRPKATTHFPTRSGNVRAYKVLRHQHLPEVEAVLGVAPGRIHFVPTSGPWTRGIWGTAHATLPDGVTESEVAGWYTAAYAAKPLVRFEAGALPELLPVVGTPFCDLGVVVQDRHLGAHVVVGFALDNLLKGAASQAVQNLNLACGLPETAGLLASGYARVEV